MKWAKWKETKRSTVHKAAFRLAEGGMIRRRAVQGLKTNGFQKNEYAWKS